MKIVEANLNEIKTRFTGETLAPIVSMAKLIKQGDKVELEKLRDLKIYDHLIDFKKLERERKLWTHTINQFCSTKYNVNKISSIVQLFVNEVRLKLF